MWLVFTTRFRVNVCGVLNTFLFFIMCFCYYLVFVWKKRRTFKQLTKTWPLKVRARGPLCIVYHMFVFVFVVIFSTTCFFEPKTGSKANSSRTRQQCHLWERHDERMLGPGSDYVPSTRPNVSWPKALCWPHTPVLYYVYGMFILSWSCFTVLMVF